MLAMTQRLLDLYARADDSPDGHLLRDNYASLIVRHGSVEDIEGLLPAFLENPEERRELIQPLMVFGDSGTGRAIFDACFEDGELKSGVSSEALHCLGYLGFEDAEKVLWKYAVDSQDHGLHWDACMGLLNLPCESLRVGIESAVRCCLGRNFFPEYIPALAHKTGNMDLLPAMIEHGRTTASDDCNGGLIFGIAMHGDAGRQAFSEIMWNPRWKANDSGTGSRWWLYLGTRALGLRITDLFSQFKQRWADGEARDVLLYNARCLVELIDYHINSPHLGLREITDPGDTLTDIRRGVFSWSTPLKDDGLAGIWRMLTNDRDERVSDLVRRLEQEIFHSLQIKELIRYKPYWSPYELSLNDRQG